MNIDRIDVFVLRHRLGRERIFAVGRGWHRESVLVRIGDRDGAFGWGETYNVAGMDGAIRAAAPILIGRDPMSARAICDDLRAAFVPAWAISAISIALDDLRGRLAGIPVSALYGGRLRERVRPYASSGGYRRDLDGAPAGATAVAALAEDWRDELAELRDRGFTAVKFRTGRHDPDAELAALRLVRGEHPDVQLMADANAGLTLPQAIRVARALDELGFAWLEEPIPQQDYAGYERLARTSSIAIAGGELLGGRGAAHEFLSRRAVDIVQPDVAICGGIGDALFIAELARLHAVTCHPHTCNSAIGLAATLQALACLPDGANLPGGAPPLLEHDAGENPMLTELLVEPLVIGPDGQMAIPNGPGLGVEVDERTLARLRVA